MKWDLNKCTLGINKYVSRKCILLCVCLYVDACFGCVVVCIVFFLFFFIPRILCARIKQHWTCNGTSSRLIVCIKTWKYATVGFILPFRRILAYHIAGLLCHSRFQFGFFLLLLLSISCEVKKGTKIEGNFESQWL